MTEPAPTAKVALEQAVTLHRAGRLDEAAAAYQAVLGIEHDHFDALHMLGTVRAQQGRWPEAITLLQAAVACAPEVAEAHYGLAFALARGGRPADSVERYQEAVRLRPDFAEAHYNLANTLRALGQGEGAVTAYRRFLELRPNVAEGHYRLGTGEAALGRFEAAVVSLQRAIEIAPERAEPHYNLGIVLSALDRPSEAVASYRRALERQPDDPDGHTNLGLALRDLGQLEAALGHFRQAVALRPEQPEMHANLGSALLDLRQAEAACACFQKAIQLGPDRAEGHYNLGLAQTVLDRQDAAIAAFRHALERAPDDADILWHLGEAWYRARELDAAVTCFARAVEIRPDHPYAFGDLAAARLRACAWAERDALVSRLSAYVRDGGPIVRPFLFLAVTDDPAAHRRCAERYAEVRIGPHVAPIAPPPRPVEPRIRLGYLSSDFREHAVGWLVAGLFERHDRDRFEVTGLSIGPDDGSALRHRLVDGFDRFVDLQGVSDREAAERIAGLGIDIAIDLNGYTQHARPAILAHRPAPVQVNHLGYPGTLGADVIDYIVVDPVVAPADHQPFFTERRVQLPDCYQVNDSARAIAAATPTRAACGLPEPGFVFCCFNNAYKITPEMFTIWMRLLDAVPGSVLWLFRESALAAANLCREAAARGIDPDRLVFAPRMAQAEHLARHRLADLFLDTLPYNAHTTGSDALWAGLPLVTCRGRAFPGRVAASLLHAVGLPELITDDLAAYEALALALARNPARLGALRRRLLETRGQMPLFDTDRFCRHLEAAYDRMWQIHRRGQAPSAIVVEAG